MGFLAVFPLLLLVSLASSGRQNLLPLYLEAKTNVIHRGASSISARITGGEPAEEGQFPYQAGLKIKIGSQSSFCGGTLISKRDILTAAHCCEGAQKIDVILGSVEIYNETEPSRVSMTVLRKGIKIHEDWDSAKLANDICMLKLSKDVELSEHIQIANLPCDDTLDYTNETVIASGWGRDSDHTQTISSELQFIKSKVIRNSICNVFYLGSIKDTNLCISGAGGSSTCNGDSGGPLVLEPNERNSTTTVVGITSFGVSFGCEIGWPPVFTRVSKYLKWIKAHMSTETI